MKKSLNFIQSLIDWLICASQTLQFLQDLVVIKKHQFHG